MSAGTILIGVAHFSINTLAEAHGIASTFPSRCFVISGAAVVILQRVGIGSRRTS
jgi:hypothetical protein